MLNFTQGDNAALKLTATDGDGNPVDLTGATLTSYIKGLNSNVFTYPNGQHTIDPDQVANKGKYTLLLPPSDTSAVPYNTPDAPKDLITKVVIAGLPIYYQGFGILNVYANTPLK